LAQAIVANRPFATVDELDRVPGIGPAKLAELRPWVVID
jgi:competence protein ComEA